MLELLRENIEIQRQLLISMLGNSMAKACGRISGLMDNRNALEVLLRYELLHMQYCKHLYVLDASMVQITSNIDRDAQDDTLESSRRCAWASPVTC